MGLKQSNTLPVLGQNMNGGIWFLAMPAALFLALLCCLFFVPHANGDAYTSIVNAEIKLSQSEFVYSGKEIRPTVVSVTLDGKKLNEGEDYRIEYFYNKNAGQALVQAIGIGKYTDRASKEFTIARRPVTVTAKSASKTYDGTALYASKTGYTVSGLVNSADLKRVELSGSQANAGVSESVVETCVFEGDLERNYELKKVNGVLTVDAAPATRLELSQRVFNYTGSEQKPGLTAYWDGGVIPASSYDVVWSSDSTNPGTKKVFIVAGGNFKGSASAMYTILGEGYSVSMFRLYNPNSGEHFYTAAQDEHDNLVSLGWNDEGYGWVAPEMGGIPVYRLYNENGGEHHYTMDYDERQMLIEAGWNDEGVGWYSDSAEGQVLYREYNPNAFSNNHNYTTDKVEHDWLIGLGWNDEGTAWYGLATE